MKGYPQTVPEFTTASAADVLAVLQYAPKVSVGELIHRCLTQFTAPAVCVWGGGVFVATGDGDVAASILAAVGADTGNRLTIRPRSGQTGKQLLWEQTANSLTVAGLVELLTNDYQARTVWALVNTSLGFLASLTVNLTVVVDQFAGAITFLDTDGSLGTALGQMTPAGQTIVLTFEAEKQKLIFE